MDKQEFIQKARAMLAGYSSNSLVRERLSAVDLIATVGPTGVGKTIIMEQSGIPYVLSDVTRPMRKHETNGVEYNFREDYDTLLREIENGEFAQYTIQLNGEFYGTKVSAYPMEGPCTMAIITSAIPAFKSLGFRMVLPVYIVPPNFTEWMKRAGSHHDKDMKARLTEAKASLETALADSSYHFMVNDNLGLAVDTFRRLAHGRPADAAAQEIAREVALQLLAQIEIV